MKKLLFLYILIFIWGLSAQTTISQVSYLTSATFNSEYDIVAVQSEGTLFFFKAVVGTSTITIHRTICSASGNIQPATPIYTYDNQVPWAGDTPELFASENRYGSTYIHLKSDSTIYVIKIPDIAINTIPTVHVFDVYLYGGYKLLGENTIYCSVRSPNSSYSADVICLDLITDTQSLIMAAPQSGYYSLYSDLGNDFLLLYVPYCNTYEECYYLIDTQGTVSPVSASELYMIAYISDSAPDIGSGHYFVNINDGLLRSGGCGFLSIDNDSLKFFCTGWSSDFGNPYHRQYGITPLGNQRFICIEDSMSMDSILGSRYVTYQMTETGMAEDTVFPNLNLPEYNYYPGRLFRISDRYIIGVSLPSTSQRRFACIDLMQHNIQPTTYAITPGTTEYQYSVFYGADKIYYIRDNTILLYFIEEVVANADNENTPVQVQVSVYPNPFSGSTKISVKNIKNTVPEVCIYNIKGQLVKTLTKYDKTGDAVFFEWDGRDLGGRTMASGMYLYKVKSAGKVISGKVLKVN